MGSASGQVGGNEAENTAYALKITRSFLSPELLGLRGCGLHIRALSYRRAEPALDHAQTGTVSEGKGVCLTGDAQVSVKGVC